MNYCNDCRHYRGYLEVVVGIGADKKIDSAVAACDLLSRDLVTGGYALARTCSNARAMECGIDARYFQVKASQVNDEPIVSAPTA